MYLTQQNAKRYLPLASWIGRRVGKLRGPHKYETFDWLAVIWPSLGVMYPLGAFWLWHADGRVAASFVYPILAVFYGCLLSVFLDGLRYHANNPTQSDNSTPSADRWPTLEEALAFWFNGWIGPVFSLVPAVFLGLPSGTWFWVIAISVLTNLIFGVAAAMYFEYNRVDSLHHGEIREVLMSTRAVIPAVVALVSALFIGGILSVDRVTGSLQGSGPSVTAWVLCGIVLGAMGVVEALARLLEIHQHCIAKLPPEDRARGE